MKQTLTNDPMLILAITDKYGKVIDSPLFAAVRVTAKLCKTLRFLANVSKKHAVASMSVRHTDAPIYWDFPPGSALDGCMVEHCQWNMLQSTLFLELWGRVHVHDGGYSETELLAMTTILDIEILETLRVNEYDIEYLDAEDTEAMLGQPFAMTVHERFLALNKLSRPDSLGCQEH